MFSRISSLRVIERPAKILISRNMGFLNDTIQNIIPFDKTANALLDVSKNGIVSTFTGTIHQKIKENNKTNYEQNEDNENNEYTKKSKLNYPKFLLVGLNNLITLCLFDLGIIKITQDKDKILKKTKEFYSKTKENLKSKDEIQEYIWFSIDDDYIGNYNGCIKDLNDKLLSSKTKVKNRFKNSIQASSLNEIYPSTPYMLYQNICCQNITLNDFKEAYNDIKKNVLNKDSKLHLGLKKITMALSLEFVCQLLQNNILGKILFSANFIPKILNDGMFKTLIQNIIISCKKFIVLNGFIAIIKNFRLTNGKVETKEVQEVETKNKTKKPDSD